MSSVVKVLRAGTLVWVSLAAACGGGGGGSSPPPPPVPDTRPNAFNLAAQSGVAPAVAVDSPAVTVSGINTATPVSISGGAYSINGGAFTGSDGTIGNGQQIVVRVTSSPNPAGEATATVTIGGVSATFTVTTTFDATPDPFTFAELVDVDIGGVVDSAAVVIGGIDVPVPITITGGEYSIDGGAFSSAAGEIENSQSIVLRMVASSEPETLRTATVTIGGVQAGFNVTTMPDLVPPVAVVQFPPLASLTSAATIAMRGTAEDEFSAITRVSIDGNAATSTDGFATWSITVPLAPGVNELLVETEDSEGNIDMAAVELAVTRNVRFGIATSLAIDEDNNRLLVVDSAADAVVAVDLGTGLRTIVSDDQTPNPNYYLLDPKAVLVDADRDRALVLDNLMSAVLAVNLSTGERTMLSGHGTPSVLPPLVDAHDLVIDEANDRLLVLLRNGQAVIAVDLDTGIRTILSNSSTPNFANFFFEPTAIAVDAAGNRALVANLSPNRAIYSVNLATGARSIMSNDTTPNANNPLGYVSAIVVDVAHARALVAQPDTATILAVDLATGARSVFSSPTVPDTVNPPLRPWSMRLDATGNRLLVLDQGLRSVMAVDLISGARSVVSASELGPLGTSLDDARGIALDLENGRALVSADGATDAVIAVDLATSVRTILSDGGVPNGNEPFASPIDLVADVVSNRAFVLDQGESGGASARVIAVDMTTGARTLISSDTLPNAGNALRIPIAIDIDDGRGRLLVADADLAAVIAVDIGTGGHTILSGNGTPDADQPFAEIEDLVVDAGGARAIVVSAEYLVDTDIVGVNLNSGVRSAIAAFGNPWGPDPPISARRLALDTGRNRVLVMDDNYYHILSAIDLASGATTIVSSSFLGDAANPFSGAGHMAYDEDSDIVYLVADDFDALMAIDARTGRRVFLAR